MDAFFAVWHRLYDVLGSGLSTFHDVFEPIFGADAAWGWAIIGLTVVIRVLLLPLAVKQVRSMREMQALQPKMSKIKEKYNTDRSLMKKDPDKYKERKQKQQEEMMALYKEHGVNPAASCLPLLLQAPIFIALYRVLLSNEATAISSTLREANFYVFGQLDTATNAAGLWGWVLVITMAASMFVSQRQMLARRGGEEEPQAQQKIMMYVMPVFLGFIAQSLPIGVLLYWVTTNFWQMGQQAVIIREAGAESDEGGDSGGPGGESPSTGSSGNGQVESKKSQKTGTPKRKPSPGKRTADKKTAGRRSGTGHLPSRPSRSQSS